MRTDLQAKVAELKAFITTRDVVVSLAKALQEALRVVGEERMTLRIQLDEARRERAGLWAESVGLKS
ncbi:hypothetical protein PJP10_32290, partial [Mycobacterium kansasii]